MTVHWLVRGHDDRPGALPTSLRRWLVNTRGVPKANVTVCGFWRA